SPMPTSPDEPWPIESAPLPASEPERYPHPSCELDFDGTRNSSGVLVCPISLVGADPLRAVAVSRVGFADRLADTRRVPLTRRPRAGQSKPRKMALVLYRPARR